MDHYEIMEQIGRGAFGAAILAHHKSEKKKYFLFSNFSLYEFLVMCILFLIFW